MTVISQSRERKLTAIFAADIAGYSLAMSADEAGTLATLAAHRAIMDCLISEFRGRIANTAGDSVLADFPSVSEAVRCAFAVQEKLAQTKESVPLQFRIGIHLGDVVTQGADLLGDGVNLAARIQGIADPGGICLSAAAHDQVRRVLPLRFRDLGSQTLKNISEPVRIFAIDLVPPLTVEARPVLALPDKPSIAVLPFTNMSGDLEQEYFADGITEDIISALSRIREFFVIARNSTFIYKGRSVNVKTVGQELGVRYILEGSVRKSGSRVRTSAQLVDASTGHPIWADKYDRDLIEIFDLQDEITRNVVATTQTQVRIAEGALHISTSRPNISIWGLVTRAMFCIYALSAESLVEGRHLAQQAIVLDDCYGPAWRCRAIALYHLAHMCFVADIDATMQDALTAAERAVFLDPADEYAHWVLGLILLALRHHDRGVAELARNEIAIRSDPLTPSIFFRYSGMALGLYLVEDFVGALEYARKSIKLNRLWYLGHVYGLAARGQIGDKRDTEAALKEYLILFPSASLRDLDRVPFRNDSDVSHLRDGLIKAGLPEDPPTNDRSVQ